MNHSCCPNAKAFKREEVSFLHLRPSLWLHTPKIAVANVADSRVVFRGSSTFYHAVLQDRDGQAVIIALRRISKNEEVPHLCLLSTIVRECFYIKKMA